MPPVRTTNSRSQSKNWCFTINNPTEGHEAILNWTDVAYIVLQKEQGEQGTPHYQGYAQFNARKRLSWLKSECSSSAHFQIARGSPQENKQYCSKPEGRLDGPWEQGTITVQGQRTDLSAFHDSLRSGCTNAKLWDDHFSSMLRYNKSVSTYRVQTTPPRSAQPTVIILVGPSGCGKTRLVRDTFPNAYWKPDNKWFDGYEQEDTIILDEFYDYWFQFSLLLRLLDRYPLLTEIKGMHTPISATTFVFTTNTHPDTWYPGVDYRRRPALDRRLKEFGQIYVWDIIELKFVLKK